MRCNGCLPGEMVVAMASDHSSAAVDTGNDMDSPLAVIIHGSCAAVGTCDNGDHPLAIVGSEGMKTDSIAQPNVRLSSSNNKGWDTYHGNDQVNGAFPFQRLPIEIQNKIIGLAVLAKNHEINFSCLTNTAFAPNITVGLLLVKWVVMLSCCFNAWLTIKFQPSYIS